MNLYCVNANLLFLHIKHDYELKPIFLVALKKHNDDFHAEFSCTQCDIKFHNKSNFKRHVRNIHGKYPLAQHACMLCRLQFPSKEKYIEHNVNVHSRGENEGGFKLMNSALGKYVRNYRKIIRKAPSLNTLLSEEYFQPLLNFLTEQHLKNGFFRTALCLIVAYDTPTTEDGQSSTRQIPLRSHNVSILGDTDLRSAIIAMLNKIIETGEHLLTLGSGFIYSEIVALDVEFTNSPIKGGHSNLDKSRIRNSQHLLSVNNEDHLCFLYCVAAFFENDRLDPTESTQYLPWIQENCNVEGIDFPIRNESPIMLAF